MLGATDWVDGYIARHFDQGSELGKILDPTADRVMLVAAAVALLVEDLPVAVDIVIWIVLLREVLVGTATIMLALAGARRIDVVWAGKAGTLAVMIALPLFLWADNDRVGRMERVRLVRGMVLRDRGYRPRVLRRREVRPGGAGGAARRTSESRRRSYEGGGARMKAVILAGGEGTRLRPLTSNQPKPMMPIANLPMMEHIVRLLARHGFDDIVVTVAFLANHIRNYFGDGSDFSRPHALRDRGVAARHRRLGAQRDGRARRDVPRHLRRRAHRRRPRARSSTPTASSTRPRRSR